MKSKSTAKNRTPEWQLEKMQMLIASNWDEMWQIVNLRASRKRNSRKRF